MTTVVEPQFLGAGWQGTWSNATDEGITSRIALNETVQTSVSANDDGMRKLAMAAASVTDMFDSNVGDIARKAVLTRAVGLVGEAMSDLANLSSSTGIVENRVKNASDRINMQVDLFETQHPAIGRRRSLRSLDARVVTASADRNFLRAYCAYPATQPCEVPDLNKPRPVASTKTERNMYQFSYADIQTDSVADAKDRERQLLTRSIDLLAARPAPRACRRSKRSRRSIS